MKPKISYCKHKVDYLKFFQHCDRNERFQGLKRRASGSIVKKLVAIDEVLNRKLFKALR